MCARRCVAAGRDPDQLQGAVPGHRRSSPTPWRKPWTRADWPRRPVRPRQSRCQRLAQMGWSTEYRFLHPRSGRAAWSRTVHQRPPVQPGPVHPQGRQARRYARRWSSHTPAAAVRWIWWERPMRWRLADGRGDAGSRRRRISVLPRPMSAARAWRRSPTAWCRLCSSAVWCGASTGMRNSATICWSSDADDVLAGGALQPHRADGGGGVLVLPGGWRALRPCAGRGRGGDDAERHRHRGLARARWTCWRWASQRSRPAPCCAPPPRMRSIAR